MLGEINSIILFNQTNTLRRNSVVDTALFKSGGSTGPYIWLLKVSWIRAPIQEGSHIHEGLDGV